MPQGKSRAHRDVRIAVLVPTGLVDLQPGVINAVHSFLRAGYRVDVFAVRNRRFALPDLGDARIIYFPITFNSDREPRLFITVAFSLWLQWALRGACDAIFAAGVRGLFAAWIYTWTRSRRIINLQLELYLGPKLRSRWASIFKWAERRAVRAAWISLIHDEHRATMLCTDTGIPRSRVLLLPNSPIGAAKLHSSTFLHRRLGIPETRKLLLAPGTLGPQFCSEEIVTAAQALPDNWLCVIHSAQPRELSDPYLAILADKNRDSRVVFSVSPVPYDQLPDLVGSARIGIALYGAAGGPNTTEVGLASGKLCQFLQLGIPVIVSDYPGLSEFVLKHKVGLPLSSLDDLPRLIDDIEADYSGYRHRSVGAFNKALSFESYFQRVIESINPTKNISASQAP